MDSASGTSTASKRQSALPRFGSTKLPAPGVKPPTASSGIPAPRPASIARAPPPSSWNAPVADTPATARARTTPTRTSNGQNTYPRPISRQAGVGVRPGSGSFSSDNDSTSGAYGLRRGSAQDIEHTRNISSEGSEEGSSSTAPSAAGDVSPVKAVRPRQSLSDRTIESLSRVPPSPGDDRRRSSFFGSAPQSPSTPRRPASQMSGMYNAPKTVYGGTKTTSLARPASPSKRPTSSYGSVTPARKGPGMATPRPAPPSAMPKAQTPATATRRSSLAYPGASAMPTPRTASNIATVRQTRPQSQIVTSRVRPPSPTKARPASPSKIRPPSPTKRPAPAKPAPVPASVETSEKENQAPSPTSSATLRQQIAQARAAAKAAAQKEQEAQAALDSGKYDFENADDPFNQRRKGEKDPLQERIDNARRDGRLNIPAMGLKTIPDEIMNMYEPEAMETSTVSWNETVDLVRFNAADNDLTEIGENVFPDARAEDLADDGKGNQFGGLEALDLHGNRLMKIPAGFRQLSRLTVLNLSRNNLDNIAVDIVSQISTLKELNLAHNSLSDELPGSIGKLLTLEVLDVSSNRLNSLPKTMRDMLFLRSLQLSNNRLAGIPFEQLAVLPKLSDISASANALTGALFPSSVQTMATLQSLDVSDNAIASFNFSKVLHLPSIVRLDVSGNRIGKFPDVTQWLKLTTLVANENALAAFPTGMTGLKMLKILSLERNSIREVDEAVADMPALEQLGLAGNPIRERKMLSMDATQIKGEIERKRQLTSDLAAMAAADSKPQ